MSLERIRKLISTWREQVARFAVGASGQPASTLAWTHSPQAGRELLESLLQTRHLDASAHELRAAGHGHYTICSAGHEANAVLGHLTTPADPALLHYRSTAFQLERARQVPRHDGFSSIMLSLVAARDEPTSGGRHKVLGHPDLGIIPTTSTIASHVPRAVGLAFAIERRPRLGLDAADVPTSVALCSFGDASLNHSTALGALNAAGWVVHQRLTLPLLLVVEDNGLGISVRTPPGWVEARLEACPQLKLFQSDGWDLNQTFAVGRAAVSYVRERRRPAVLHLRCARLLGHAGSDVDSVYRSPAEIAELEARDPVLNLSLALISSGASSVEEVVAMERRIAEQAAAQREVARTAPRLTTRIEVEEALVADPSPLTPGASAATNPFPRAERITLAQGINAALREGLDRYPEAMLFGEDVAKKGGVYGLTKGLLAHAGTARVFNTLLDEQTILGLALGTASWGLLPIPEIQYLAYLHNAEDQLRGEAATLSFFSQRQEQNPMVVRIASFAYQRGFGGHFHNDNSIAVLRDIPGLVLAVPARGDDALELYRTALRLARERGRVVVMLEPIALYHTRDLDSRPEGWLATPSPREAELGRARVYEPEARHLTIATYGNGLYLSLDAAQELRERGIEARVVDLRWLAPLPESDIIEHALATKTLLVVDECRRSGNVSEAIATLVLERQLPIRFARVTGADSFVPLGDAARLVLVSKAEIVAAGLGLAQSRGVESP